MTAAINADDLKSCEDEKSYTHTLKLLEFSQRQIKRTNKKLVTMAGRYQELMVQIGSYGQYIVRPGIPYSQVLIYTDLLQAYSNGLKNVLHEMRKSEAKLRKFKGYEKRYKHQLSVIVNAKETNEK